MLVREVCACGEAVCACGEGRRMLVRELVCTCVCLWGGSGHREG